MNTLKAALIWITVGIASIYSAQAAAPSQVLEFSDSEGTTFVIYSN